MNRARNNTVPSGHSALLVLLLFLLLHTTVVAEWRRSNGPEGGRVNCMINTGTAIIAGTDKGIYRSENDGQSWSMQSEEIAGDMICNDILEHNGTLWLSSKLSGIVRSTDNGRSWTRVSVNLPEYERTGFLFALNNDIYTVVAQKKIFRFNESQAEWELRYDGTLFNRIETVTTNQGAIFVGTAGNGVFRSEDAAQSWTALTPDFSADDKFDFTIYRQNGVLLLGTLRGAWRSTDNGDTWQNMANTLLPLWGVNVFAGTGEIVYAYIHSQGIYRSSDLGASWRQINQTPLRGYDVRSMVVNNRGELLAGLYMRGVYYIPADNSAWQPRNNGMMNTRCSAVAVNSRYLFAGSGEDDFGLLSRSSDGGITWESINEGYGMESVTGMWVNGERLYISTNGLGVYRSTDNGAVWESLTAHIPGRYTRGIIQSGEWLLVGTEGFSQGIFRSGDGGDTWEAANEGYSRTNVSAFVQVGNVVIVGARSPDGIYKSTNHGAHWTLANSGMENQFVSDLASDGENVYAATINGVFKSEDQAETWYEVNTGFGESKYVAALAVSGRTVFAGMHSGGVYISTDGGGSWNKSDEALPVGVEILDFYVDAQTNTVYAGTNGHGMWYRQIDLSPTAVEERNPRQDNLYAECIPNPFRNTVSITYTLTTPGIVQLDIYTLAGNRVYGAKHSVETPGSHTLEWHGKSNTGHSLPAGVYYYRLHAGTAVLGGTLVRLAP